MFLRRQKAPADITEGSVYRRTTRGKSVETARVLAVSKDSVGITHVRFSVHYEGRYGGRIAHAGAQLLRRTLQRAGPGLNAGLSRLNWACG